MLPVSENGFCEHCDPFQHGSCLCKCIQCNTVRKQSASTESAAEATDIIKPNQCSCISADGTQRTLTPLEGYEFCEDCSAGYCDCTCKKCCRARKEGEPGMLLSEKTAVPEATLHEHSLDARLSNTQAAQVLGLTDWIDNPPLEGVHRSLSKTSLPIQRRLANRSASLSENSRDREAADSDNSAEWCKRVSRKHRISSSSSPEVRRSGRSRKKTVRFQPRNSITPDDDSSSYSDTELQDALQQKGIPTLVSKANHTKPFVPPRPKQSRKLQPKATKATAKEFVPPLPLRPEHRLPSSRQVAVQAAGRTRQLTINRYHQLSSSPSPKRKTKRSKKVGTTKPSKLE